MLRAREYFIKAYRSQGSKFVSKTIFEMMMGIVSSKEGHDEFHIDDTKLET